MKKLFIFSALITLALGGGGLQGRGDKGGS